MKISFDTKSFLFEGQRRLILSGDVHYFRLPKAEWKDVLEKALQAGLNAISTYIPWNLHEPREGKWDFEGEQDLEAFLKLCKQMGLMVIAKPGPFIRSDWSFGGFPAWLHAKGVRHFRTSDATYMAVVDKWLDKSLGILARHQWGKGGTVILVQIEDAFDLAPQDPAYLRHLENKFKKKLSVPVYFNLAAPNTGGGFVKGALLGASLVKGASAALKRLRELNGTHRQPLLISQLFTAQAEYWNGPKPANRSWADLESSLNEGLAGGAALLNLAPFAGGTHLNELGGRGLHGDKSFALTRWDGGAPIGESGQRTAKALSLGLWSRWARTMETALLGSETIHEDHPVVPSEVAVQAREQGDTRIYFLHNPTNEPLTGRIQVDEPLPFTLQPGERRAYAFNIPVSPNLSVRGCTHPYFVTHLGGRAVIVVWGEAGQKLAFYGSGTLDVAMRSNDQILVEHERKGFMMSAEFTARPQRLLAKVMFESGVREALFLIVTRPLAEQCATDAAKGLLVLGSAEVDFQHKTARLEAGSRTLIRVSETEIAEDYAAVKPVTAKTVKLAPTGALPEDVLIERALARKDWTEAVVGKDLAEYGYLSNRAWIRLQFKAATAGKKYLIFPDVEDQFAVFFKGQFLGLYGRLGKGLDLELPVKAGDNELFLLVHSWGRYGQGSKLGEKKGLLQPVFDGGEVQAFGDGWHFLEAAGPLDFKIFSSPTFSGRGWELGALPKMLERSGFVCARKKFKVPDWAKRVRLNLHGGDVRMQVALNGDLIGEHPDARGAQYQEFELTPYLIAGENTMALFFKGPASGFQHCELLFLGADLKAKMTICEGLYAPDETLAMKDKGWSKAKKGKYGFWRTSFKTPPLKDVASASLSLTKHGRGVVWLNGHCLGRHWKNGAEAPIKLPLSWLKPVNDVLVLEEEAGLPQESTVTFEPRLSEEKLP
jgi:beta-galactosidase